MDKIIVNIKAGSSYPYIIDNLSSIERMIGLIASCIKRTHSTVVVITDNKVKDLYAKILSIELEKKILRKVSLISIVPGEASKTAAIKEYLESEMFKSCCNRQTLCIAFGGGVVGDLAAFVASTYMRGIDVMHIPTTLLAMVDSSIGGKTAINNQFGKNLIGTYHQPIAIVSNLHYLSTLDQPQFIGGLLEIIKIFAVYSKNDFEYLENRVDLALSRDALLIEKIVKVAAKLKIQIIGDDEQELGIRSIINFGHTFGHTFELLSDFKMLHGTAVGLGMLMEAKLGTIMGITPQQTYDRINHILGLVGIKPRMLVSFRVEDILHALRLDKKNKYMKPHCVMVQEIGHVYKINVNAWTTLIEDNDIKAAYKDLISECMV